MSFKTYYCTNYYCTFLFFLFSESMLLLSMSCSGRQKCGQEWHCLWKKETDPFSCQCHWGAQQYGIGTLRVLGNLTVFCFVPVIPPVTQSLFWYCSLECQWPQCVQVYQKGYPLHTWWRQTEATKCQCMWLGLPGTRNSCSCHLRRVLSSLPLPSPSTLAPDPQMGKYGGYRHHLGSPRLSSKRLICEPC